MAENPSVWFHRKYPLSKCYGTPHVPIMLHMFEQAERQHADVTGLLRSIAELLDQLIERTPNTEDMDERSTAKSDQ